MNDRYLKVILTIIALELFWIAIGGSHAPVAAQAQNPVAATPVVITGIRLSSNTTLPVAVRGQVAIVTNTPIKVEADRALPVAQIPYTPTTTPR